MTDVTEIERKTADGATLPEAVREVKDALADFQTKIGKKADDAYDLAQQAKSGSISKEAFENHSKETEAELKRLFGLIEPLEKAIREGGRPAGQKAAGKTLAEQFAEHKGIQAVRDRNVTKARIELPGIDTKAVIDEREFKTITSAANSAGVLIQTERRPGIIEKPLRPLSIRDILPSRSTGSNAIEFVRENVFTNNAAPVAEGALKPSSDLTFALTTVNVRTLAHVMKASLQVLDDAAGLASYAINRGRGGLLLKEEDQLLTGDGTGQNLTGLVPNATAFVHTGIPNGNASQQVDRIRWAALQVRKNFFAADTVVLNPHDWAVIELLKDTQGNYLYSAFTSGTTPRLWGMTVVESDAIAQGSFLCGNFSLAAEIADRQGVTVDISTENEDDFVKNMATIRVESRLALQIFRPAAFVFSDKLTGNFA